jgi:hypothetical protein
MQPGLPNPSPPALRAAAPATVGAASTLAVGLRKYAGPGWIYAYVAIQFACQFALLTKTLAPARVFFRSGSFGASLLFLILVPGSSRSGANMARTMALVIMTIVTFSAFNPGGAEPLAVLAHWAMYLGVLAPLFWVARLDVGDKTLERLLLILWAFHTASSAVGLLQVYFPGQFQPALTTFIQERQALMIRLASGEAVIRPMGLTDTPGGAAGSGLYAALIGIGVFLTRPFSGARFLGVASMTIGLACIYLSQVRSALVMLGFSFFFLIGLLTLSARLPRAAWLLVVGGLVVFVGFEVAFDVAGNTVTDRLATLVQYDPGTVYRTNRGNMIEEAISELLPQYPLGAGLARWGMMNLYFGSSHASIGAEVQWVAWILDGGILLVLAYPVALLGVTLHAIRECLKPSETGRDAWAGVVAAYDIGGLALCFSYVPFMTSVGLELWLLNAVLIQSTRNEATRARASFRPMQRAFTRVRS